MRRLPMVLAGVVLLVPLASAEFGRYDEHGYPVNVLGESTFPGGLVPGGGTAGPLNVAGPLTVYPYYPVLTLEVQRLARDHPDLVKLHSAGKSALGLELWMLEIADFARIDAGEGRPLEGREVVWVDGGTHSNEYSGVYFVAHLASFLVDEYATNETARWIVENRHTWILPMINPDGSNAFGRLNANLVNINRNYPVVWDGEGNDAFMNNRGPHPASEPETRINIEWLNRTRPDYYASVHCCGNLWLYPYGEEGVDPVDDEVLSRVCDEAFPTVREDCGPIWSTIYPASGSSVDTAYEYTGAVAFGYEMSGRGAVSLWGQPFTHQSVRVQEVESWEGVLHALLHVHRYGAWPVFERLEQDAEGYVLTVRNEGYGNLTAGNLSVGDRSVALPFLRPGESSTLRLPALEADVPHDVTLRYVKRVAAAPEGALGGILTVGPKSGSLRLAGSGEELLQMAAGSGAEENRGVPAPGIPLALVALVLLGMALRRR